MIFLTRELYELMQQQSVPLEDRRARWQTASAARLAHQEAIKLLLPPGMRDFSEITLHDGVIETAVSTAPGELVLKVDSRGNPWGPRGLCTLTFRGVKATEGLNTCVGAYWLYEEVHLHPDAGFDYRVFLGDGELQVVANEVEFRVDDPSPPPVVGINIPFTGDGGLYVWDAEGGRAGGWVLLRDGRREARDPAPELLEEMRRFALGIGVSWPETEGLRNLESSTGIAPSCARGKP